MDSWVSTRHHIGWFKFWQTLQPQASCFGFPVTKLPWLDYLIWLSKETGHDAYWILNHDFIYSSLSEHQEKLHRLLLRPIDPLFGEPSSP